ncbi:MAG: thioredoxin TrxC [Syntrophales bacterium LBB04]|nr:thioredoxin TrxC [Syntrophales bacterium LBB04]
MKSQDMIIRCLNCGTKNRIPQDRLHDRPACGRCHAPLDDMLIRCLSCGTKNRMPEDRLQDRPICGKCGARLVIGSEEGRPVDVTDLTFSNEVLSSWGSVLVDCWAPWCGPCRTVSPILDELAAKYAGGVKIAKLNVDENPLIASQYDIRSIPTMLLFKNGKLVNRLLGAQPREEIERQLLSIMKTN